MPSLRIGMAQINTTVGDFEGNVTRIQEVISRAKPLGVDLLTFPELTVCGYPPEDLMFKPSFIHANRQALDEVIKGSAGMTLVVGFVDKVKDYIYDAAAVIHDGKLAGVYRKIYLPNYGVFDERRYFKEGSECPVYTIADVNVGVIICEDMWFDTGPFTVQARSGALIIVNISASPYHMGKGSLRETIMRKRTRDNAAAFIYTNLVGGQDELVFDGSSLALNAQGDLIARGRQFDEDLTIVDIDTDEIVELRARDDCWSKGRLPPEARNWRKKMVTVSEAIPTMPKPPLPEREAQVRDLPGEVYDALVLGTRDYVRKNGFDRVLIGLSGGVDSSLVATIAVDALGSSNVTCISMPSRYSSSGSVSDSELLSRNLGINLLNIPIEPVFRAYEETLAEAFTGTEPNVAEENIQARIRSNILMALSNKFGWLVLTTGNKSEMATGYATLYGDMAGGFAVIKDVPKTLVYELCRYRNALAGNELIPNSIIGKPPSAELRPDQMDTDSLPPYDLLDPILISYVVEDRSVQEITAMGFDKDVVHRVSRLVDNSEYKRRQAPPGIKITPKAFGRDRRLPITNRFKG